MAVDWESLDKLSPQDRLKALQELKVKLKEEQDMLKKRLHTLELDQADVEQSISAGERDVVLLSRVRVPSVKQKTVEEKLETPVSATLEGQVEQVPSPQQIHQRLHDKSTDEIYKRLSTLFYEKVIQENDLNKYQENFVEAARQEIYERQKKEQTYKSDDSRLSASEKLVKYLRG
ncbi:hypothetical protein HY490_03125 [Candidatus Woesearchaeota archaeon]|nr:hypothetical protein [Candidatus Woesearchaeota archaeon]